MKFCECFMKTMKSCARKSRFTQWSCCLHKAFAEFYIFIHVFFSFYNIIIIQRSHNCINTMAEQVNCIHAPKVFSPSFFYSKWINFCLKIRAACGLVDGVNVLYFRASSTFFFSFIFLFYLFYYSTQCLFFFFF